MKTDERVLKTIMKILFWIAIGVALGMFWAYQQKAYARCMNMEPAAWVASPKIKAAHKFHGITFSESSPDGNFYFIRDGQRCTLFNTHFEMMWDRTSELRRPK